MKSPQEINFGNDDIHRFYTFSEKSTQKTIAWDVEQIYIPNFRDVKIDEVKFEGIDGKVVNESQLPREKIQTEGAVLV